MLGVLLSMLAVSPDIIAGLLVALAKLMVTARGSWLRTS